LFVVEGDVYDEQPDGEADDEDLESAGENEPTGRRRREGENWRIHHRKDTSLPSQCHGSMFLCGLGKLPSAISF
jgi:hypothetical protein